jgi:hypothetical protein
LTGRIEADPEDVDGYTLASYLRADGYFPRRVYVSASFSESPLHMVSAEGMSQ